jgi:protein-S-isoprenylcysteine O-methyltransferase Ste14
MSIIPLIFLPIYFTVYFGVVFVLRTVIVARRTGKNPLVLPKDDSVQGTVGRYFKLTCVLLFIYTFVVGFFSESYDVFLPIEFLENSFVSTTGFVLLNASMIWTAVAQFQMGDLWKIGIDEKEIQPLLTSGLFSMSRNPVFFGMIVSLGGLFLFTPNAATLLFLILGYVLIQLQTRMEEDYLSRVHGISYENYCKRVRRFI